MEMPKNKKHVAYVAMSTGTSCRLLVGTPNHETRISCRGDISISRVATNNRFQFPNWDVQTHEEISRLSKGGTVD